jgi:hypothetical protein
MLSFGQPQTPISLKNFVVEHYPSGYPQYSALISSHDPFFVFRSFRRLRARLLLSKQDEIAVLESELDTLDREEAAPFFLGTCRRDGNISRATVLSQIHTKLAEYGNSFLRLGFFCCRVLLSRYSPRRVCGAMPPGVELQPCQLPRRYQPL